MEALWRILYCGPGLNRGAAQTKTRGGKIMDPETKNWESKSRVRANQVFICKHF